MRRTVLGLCLLLTVATACDSSEPDDMSTTSDPAAYCQSHPDAMPDCAGLDLDACEAHPFCDPYKPTPCAGEGPEDWVETKIPCATTRGCVGTALDYDPHCTPEYTFARAAGEGGDWYLFYNDCIPDGWITAEESDGDGFQAACGMLKRWYR